MIRSVVIALLLTLTLLTGRQAMAAGSNPALERALDQYARALAASLRNNSPLGNIRQLQQNIANACPPLLVESARAGRDPIQELSGATQKLLAAIRQEMAKQKIARDMLPGLLPGYLKSALRSYCTRPLPADAGLSLRWRVEDTANWLPVGGALNVPAGAVLQLRATVQPPVKASYYITVERDNQPSFAPSDGNFVNGAATTRLTLPPSASGNYVYTFYASIAGEKQERHQPITVAVQTGLFLESEGRRWTAVASADNAGLQPKRFIATHWNNKQEKIRDLAHEILAKGRREKYWQSLEPGLKAYRSFLIASGGKAALGNVNPEALLKGIYTQADTADLLTNISAGTLAKLPFTPGHTLGDLTGDLAYPMIALDAMLKLEEAVDSNEKETALDQAFISALNQSLGTWLSQTYHFSYGSLTWMTGKILSTAQDYSFAGFAEKWEEQFLDWAIECGWLQHQGHIDEQSAAFKKTAAAARGGKLKQAVLRSLQDGLKRNDGSACALGQALPHMNQISGTQNLPRRFVDKLIDARPDDFFYSRSERRTYFPYEFYKAVYESLVRKDKEALALQVAKNKIDADEKLVAALDRWPAAPKLFSVKDAAGRAVAGAKIIMWPPTRRPAPSNGQWSTSETGSFQLEGATALDFSPDGRMVLGVERPGDNKRLYFIVERSAFFLPEPTKR